MATYHMKNRESADKLVDEMATLIEALRQEQWDQTWLQQVALKTGDVLGALEVFTFINFNDAEQETIFTRARTKIERHEGGEPITER